LGVFINGTQVLTAVRALRLLRVFRILKLARFVHEAHTLTRRAQAGPKP
jgi:voltage-gated potassium channel